jgi:LPXTG-site transpeptidase (sortase) family protein
MHRTLDSLIQEQAIHKKPQRKHFLPVWLHEVKLFLAIFVAIFFGMLVFTNANLFMHALGITHSAGFGTDSLAFVDDSIADITADRPSAVVDEILEKYTQEQHDPLAIDVQTILENRLSYYSFDFNTLPPVDRVIVAGISLDVPLISTTSKSEGDFIRGDFDEELKNGVVKYPTTPVPGEWWNTLLFGHTSQERREKNPYGTVFSNLPKLQYGDEVQVVWKGELYTYKVVETVIRRPKDVDAEFQKREEKDKEYITLMWCYPLGTTKQRMMVIAERVF